MATVINITTPTDDPDAKTTNQARIYAVLDCPNCGTQNHGCHDQTFCTKCKITFQLEVDGFNKNAVFVVWWVKKKADNNLRGYIKLAENIRIISRDEYIESIIIPRKKRESLPQNILLTPMDVDVNNVRVTSNMFHCSGSCSDCGKKWDYDNKKAIRSAYLHSKKTGHRIYISFNSELLFNWDGTLDRFNSPK